MSVRHPPRSHPPPPLGFAASLPGMTQSVQAPCLANPSLGIFTIIWPCNNLNVDVSGPSNWQGSIEGAFTGWNSALNIPYVSGRIPHFDWTSDTGASEILVRVSGSPATWCGQFDRDSRGVGKHSITMSSGPCGEFGVVLKHEFAHAIGFTSHTVQGQAGVSEECVFPIASSGPEKNVLHANFCQHEVEYVYQAYGQRLGGFSPNSFWDHPVVTGYGTSPYSVSVDQGSSTQVTVDELRFDRGQQFPTPPGASAYAWSVLPPSLATVNSAGQVTGQLVGSGSIVIRPTAVPPVYIVSTDLLDRGHSLPITVNDTSAGCPPAPTLRVTSVTTDQEPAITSSGWHTFLASAVGCQGPVLYDWTFDPSKPGLPTTTLLNQQYQVTYSVPSGSYALSVTALPHHVADSTFGYPLIRFVNVCTSGAGGSLMYAQGSIPGEDAVAGCGGGPQ